MNTDSPIDRKNVFYKYRILIACLLLVIATLVVYWQVRRIAERLHYVK